MKKIGNVFFTCLIGLVTTVGTTQAAGKGTSGGQFLRIGVGARAAAMGGAFSPVADDATAIYYNPAGLALLEKKELALSYNAYFQDTASQFMGYAHPTEGHGTMAAGISLFGVKDIEKRSAAAGDADTPDLGKFDTKDMALSLGWANKMGLGGGKFNFGAAVKYISSDLGTKKAATGAVDLGALYNLREGEGLSLSLAVLNLGGELKFQDSGDPLPLDIKPGLGYRMNLGRMGKLNAAIDSDIMVHDGNGTVQPGLEWWAHPMFAFRTGYQFGRDKNAGSGFAAGVGFRIMALSLDYAFVPFGDLGDTHRVAIGLKF